MSSHTQENYLKCIYRITEKNGAGASTSHIAEMLQTSAATVTDMLKKLAQRELIHYEKYRAVTLTESGKKKALMIIRNHRLWEVFLAEKLHFKWDEVHEIAEQLEHIQSDELTNRLELFLGSPRVDPHGDPIPNRKGKMQLQKSFPLSMAGQNQEVEITGVDKHNAGFLHYLDEHQLQLGKRIAVKKINDFDGSFTIKVNSKKVVYISRLMAENILVK